MALALGACGTSTSAPSPSTSPSPSASGTPAPSPSEPAAPPVETVKLNVAYMPNYASLWSVLTAIDRGYFAEESLEITLWEFADGPSEIAAMEGGSIDLAYIGHGAHRLCINGQASIFAPSSVHSTDRIIVLPSSGVTSVDGIANLKGKKVAYNAGSSSETALKGALAAAGLTMDDIEAYEMDATNMVAAMLSNSVDACTAWVLLLPRHCDHFCETLEQPAKLATASAQAATRQRECDMDASCPCGYMYFMPER